MVRTVKPHFIFLFQTSPPNPNPTQHQHLIHTLRPPSPSWQPSTPSAQPPPNPSTWIHFSGTPIITGLCIPAFCLICIYILLSVLRLVIMSRSFEICELWLFSDVLHTQSYYTGLPFLIGDTLQWEATLFHCTRIPVNRPLSQSPWYRKIYPILLQFLVVICPFYILVGNLISENESALLSLAESVQRPRSQGE